MKAKRLTAHMIVVFALLLCSMLVPLAAYADEPVAEESSAAEGATAADEQPAAEEPVLATEKSETVNVKTNANGEVESVEVSNLLLNEAKAKELLDATELTDVKGDDYDFTKDDIGLVWTANGENVSYTGKTTKELPVQIKVTYKLNDEVVQPEDIAGKAGDVCIRYDFINKNGFLAYVNMMTVDMFTPFTCITAVMLDGDNFSNVTVENAKIINDGSDYIITGYSMPGFKESLGSLAKNINSPGYFEICAKTTDFQLKSTMTMVTAGLLTDLDLESMGFDDMTDASSGLQSGIDELISGSDELTSGMNDLADGAKKVGEGTDEIATGAQELADGLNLLAYGEDGESGLKGAASSTRELVKYLNTIGDSLATIADEKTGLTAVASGLDQLAQSYPSEKQVQGLITAIEMDPSLDAKTKAAIEAIIGSTANVKELSAATSKYAEGIVALNESYQSLLAEAEALPTGLKEAAKAAAQLQKGAAKLAKGATKLSSGANELSDGVRSAADGSTELTDGLVTYNNEGVSEVVYTIDNDLGGLKKRLNILSEESKAYDTFTGKREGTTSSVKFVFETAAVETD